MSAKKGQLALAGEEVYVPRWREYEIGHSSSRWLIFMAGAKDMCDDEAWESRNLSLIRSQLNLPAMALLILLSAASAIGQTPSAGNAKTNSDYSKEAYVVEKFRTVATFENDGTSSRETTVAVRMQSEAGVQRWGVLSAGYSSANEQVEVGYVRVRKADGTVVETPADSAQDITSEVMRVAPMYTDYREKHLAVKGLGVGDVLESQITVRLRTPFIPGQFWFAYDFDKTGIVLDEEVEVNVPRERELKVKSPDLKPVIEEEGKRRIYTWKNANHEVEKNDEPRREFPSPAILLSTFKSWEEVGRWWNGLEQQSLAPTPEIRAKAAELTRDATTREEKVRALYNYVAMRFHYISISFGIGRYQPRAAAEVLKNAYGDCKDKHTLLASLLAAVGIEAFPVLMNSSRHIDPEVPSPGQFDHVVTAVPETPQGSRLIWLDTTTEVAPFGFLIFALRDKQALVIPATTPPVLVNTPADPPFKSFRRFEIDAKLSDSGVLEGKMQRSYRGDSELLLRTVFRQVPQSQWKEAVQGIAQGMGFAGEVSEVEVGSPEATSEPFHFTNKYIRKDYPDWANHRITPPLGFVGFAEIKEGEKRTQPILLGAREEITDIARVELPKGYGPGLLPGVDVVRDFAEYHSSYTFKDGAFIVEVRLVIKKSEVPLSALDDYKSLQKAVSNDRNQYTELSNVAESVSIGRPAPKPSSNPEATRLVQKGREAFGLHDEDRASDALERALKLDRRYKEAWLVLANVRLDQGRFDEGIAAFRKAIELDPKDTQSYIALAKTYRDLKRPEESVKVWREVLKQEPDQQEARINLATALLQMKRYAEAVPELEALLSHGAGHDLQLDLADAYLGAKNYEKAVATLKLVGKTSTTPETWNTVARTFAESNLDLADAQLYAVKAVHAAEDRAVQTSLEELAVADLEGMTRLASYWDTLGWVYLHQGNLEGAQKYIEAAWNLNQTQAIGEHLAQVYKVQGKKEQGDHQLGLTQTLDPSGKGMSVRQPDGGFSLSPKWKAAHEELLDIRRTKLGNLSTQKGRAAFFVLLAPGGTVEDVKFISGDEQIRPLSKVVTALKFKAPLPDDAPVKLLRRGVLVCEGGNLGCDFTLFTVDSVHSIE